MTAITATTTTFRDLGFWEKERKNRQTNIWFFAL